MIFDKNGGEKIVSYTIRCNGVTPMFSVSSDAVSWLKINDHNEADKKITVSATTNGDTSRTGYIIATIGTETCTTKKLTVTQNGNTPTPPATCTCLDSTVSPTQLTWTFEETVKKEVNITTNKSADCPITNVVCSNVAHFSASTATTTDGVKVVVGKRSDVSSPTTDPYVDTMDVTYDIGGIHCNDSINTKHIELIWNTQGSQTRTMSVSPKVVTWNYSQGAAYETRTLYVSVDGVDPSEISDVTVSNSNPNNFSAYVNSDNTIKVVTKGTGPTQGGSNFTTTIAVSCKVGSQQYNDNSEGDWKKPACNCEDTLDIESNMGWASNNVEPRRIYIKSNVCGVSADSCTIIAGSSHFTCSEFDTSNKCYTITPKGNAPTAESTSLVNFNDGTSGFTGTCELVYHVEGVTGNCPKVINLKWYAPTTKPKNYCQRAYLGNRYSQWLYNESGQLRQDYLHLDNSSYKFKDDSVKIINYSTGLGDGWYVTKDKNGNEGHFKVKVLKNNQGDYTFSAYTYNNAPTQQTGPYNEYCDFEYEILGYGKCTDKLSLFWGTQNDSYICSCKNIRSSVSMLSWRNNENDSRDVRIYKNAGSCEIVDGSITTNADALADYFDVTVNQTNKTVTVTPIGNPPDTTINDRLEVSCNLRREGEMECNKCALIPLTWYKAVSACTDLDFYTPSIYVGRIRDYYEEFEISSAQTAKTLVMCANTANISKLKVEVTTNNGGTTTYIVTSSDCEIESGSEQWLYLQTEYTWERDKSTIKPCTDFSSCIGRLTYYIDENTSTEDRIATITVYPYLDGVATACTNCTDRDWGPCNVLQTKIIQLK